MLMKTVKLLQIRKEFDPTSCRSETIFDRLFVFKSGRSWRKVDGLRGLNGQVRTRETGRFKAVQFRVTVHFGPDSIIFYRFNSKKECIAEEFATAEARIIDTILHGYNSDIRPSVNGSGAPVQVMILKNCKVSADGFEYQ